MIRPYFCFWNTGQQALAHFDQSSARARSAKAAHLVGTPQVNRDDLVPHLLVHVLERLVSEDTGVGNEYVNGPECIDTGLDDSVSVFSGADSGDGVSTG